VRAVDTGASEGPSTPPLAVITVTHNSSDAIAGWLDALERTGRRDQLEIIVVDSGSNDADRERLRELVRGRVDHLRLEQNVGYGAAGNIGAGVARASTLLFLNPDAEIVSMPERLFDGPLDDTLIGGFHLTDAGRRVPLGYRHAPTGRWQVNRLLLGRHSRAFVHASHDPAWVSGAALAVDRTRFAALGGFSPDFFLFFEDADLCVRFRAAGGRVEVDPSFEMRHRWHGSSGERARTLAGVSKLSGRTFAKRHDGAHWVPLLYLAMVGLYLPRRVLLLLLRRLLRREATPAIGTLVLDELRPSRVTRLLGATHASGDSR
jgi:N-acetylglucosaminyl-diphospho-decaprenol L-rhamnosyltransferase